MFIAEEGRKDGRTDGRTEGRTEGHHKPHRTTLVLWDFNFSDVSLHHSLHLIALVPFLLRQESSLCVEPLGRPVVLVDLEEDAVVPVVLGGGQDFRKKRSGDAGSSVLWGHDERREVQCLLALRLVRSTKGGEGAFVGDPRIIPTRRPVLRQKVGDREGRLAIRRQERNDAIEEAGKPELQRWDTSEKEKSALGLGHCVTG